MERKYKVRKSENPMAGHYYYRACYIAKSTINHWFVRAAEMGVNLPAGIHGKTRKEVIEKIDLVLGREGTEK